MMDFQMPNSKWIWLPEWGRQDSDKACLVYFRRSFMLSEAQLTKKQKECLIRVSADTRYKLYVNGVLVQIGPSKGDRSVWYYDTVNIGPYLNEGDNVLAAEVVHYPLQRNAGKFSLFRTEIPGLYIDECEQGHKEPIDQTYEDYYWDRQTVAERGLLGLTADSNWKCLLVEGFQIVAEASGFAPLMINENRIGNRAYCGWNNIGFDDNDWKEAYSRNVYEVSTSVVPGNLIKRPIPYMYREEKQFTGIICCRETTSGNEIREDKEIWKDKETWEDMLAGKGIVTIPANSHEVVEINAGEEETGFLSVRLAQGSGATVHIVCAEAYMQKNESVQTEFEALHVKKDRFDYLNGELVGYTDLYHVAGYGTLEESEVYEPFWFRTFRFIKLEIETREEPLVLTGFDYQETGYPLKVITKVETSDETLESVWDISLRTLKRCMQETYTDCPYYEQLQYAMDSRSQILYTYMISADDRLARQCMDDFRRSQRYDGMINCSYPCYVPNIIPGFSIYYILMLHDHMMYFGDKEFLRGFLGSIDQVLEFFHSNIDARGLVGKVGGLNVRDRYWSFIDWTTQWNETTGVPKAILQGPITMESFLYIAGLSAAADINEFLNRKDTAVEYRERADQVRASVNKYCTDENGMYMDGPDVAEYSQHCQVFALLTDTVDIVNGRKYLEKTLLNTQKYAQCSVAMSYYLFRAMQKAGIYEQVDGKWNIWREMVQNNLTTCVEDGVTGRSDCHAWGALALFELPAVVLGVQPAVPGFSKAYITPEPGYLTWAKGSVATPKGIIHVEWEINSTGEIHLEFNAPDSIEIITEV